MATVSFPNQTLTPDNVAALMVIAGPPGLSRAKIGTGICITTHESGRQTHPKDNINSNGSRDRGLWQINDKAHPDVPDSVAYNPALATAAARRISNDWTDFSPWTTYAFCHGAAVYRGTPNSKGIQTSLGGTPIDKATQPIGDAVNSVGNALSAMAKFLAQLFSPSFWLRTGKVILGVLLLLFGMFIFVKAALGDLAPAKL